MLKHFSNLLCAMALLHGNCHAMARIHITHGRALLDAQQGEPGDFPGGGMYSDDNTQSPFTLGDPQPDTGQMMCDQAGARELDVCDTSDPSWLRYCFRRGRYGFRCLYCGVESSECCPASVLEDSFDDGCGEGLYCDYGRCYNLQPAFPPGLTA